MKRIFVSIVFLSFLACNNEQANQATAGAKPSVPANTHGFAPGYSYSFVMDSAVNTEKILALWADWQSGDLSKTRGLFADSISLFMADGTNMSGATDELMKGVQEFRNNYTSVVVGVDAAFAVKCADNDEKWVAIWGTEINTDKNGKVDSISLQETWRFNKEGKVDLMFQAARKGIIPPPPSE